VRLNQQNVSVYKTHNDYTQRRHKKQVDFAGIVEYYTLCKHLHKIVFVAAYFAKE